MMQLIEKIQPIPKDTIKDIGDFVQALADKDIQAFGLCYVHRDGKIYALHHECDREYALPNAVDYLAHRVKGGIS